MTGDATPAAALSALAAALVATPLLAAAARRTGWVDRRSGSQAGRKPRRTPVPTVGGAALLAGLAAASLAGGPELCWPALLAAFAVGTVDDLLATGLGPAAKLAGQGVAALLLAQGAQGEALEPLVTALVAVVAMNAVNTYDNADGTAAGLAAVGLWGGPGAAAALGFLPWNLVARRGAERAPVAYLGDAGSHVLGVLFAASPAAWPFLALPLADLARLSFVRRARGRPPWSGDRLHLAHRLAAAGLGPVAVAAALTAAAAPPWAARALLAEPAAVAVGVAATLAAFGALWAATPDPEPRSANAPPAKPGAAKPGPEERRD